MRTWFGRARGSSFLNHFALLPALASLLVLFPTGLVMGHEGLHELIAFQTKAVEKSPSDPLLRLELASLYGKHGDLELSLQNLDRVDALAPGKYPTDLLRADAFMTVRDFARAKESLDRQLAAHPEAVRAWLLRARAERELDQREASLADYREALRRTPSPEPDLVQEVADALSTNGKKEEAAAVLAAGIERLGKIPSLVLRTVDLEVETKHFDAALRRIEDARSNAPRPEPWMARRATVLAQAGRIEESRAAWKALLERLDSLPDDEKASSAMTKLREDAHTALK